MKTIALPANPGLPMLQLPTDVEDIEEMLHQQQDDFFKED